jgi:hypothetical protein
MAAAPPRAMGTLSSDARVIPPVRANFFGAKRLRKQSLIEVSVPPPRAPCRHGDGVQMSGVDAEDVPTDEVDARSGSALDFILL